MAAPYVRTPAPRQRDGRRDRTSNSTGKGTAPAVVRTPDLPDGTRPARLYDLGGPEALAAWTAAGGRYAIAAADPAAWRASYDAERTALRELAQDAQVVVVAPALDGVARLDAYQRASWWHALGVPSVLVDASTPADVDAAADDATDHDPRVTAEEWPPLHPFHARELPRIGADLLPAWAGDFAGALSRSTETPEELPLAMVLAACSAATARALRVQVSEGHAEVSNLWILLALPPGSRKSAVQVAAAQPLATWEAEHADTMRETIARARSARATAEARAKVLRSKAAAKGDTKAAREAADIEADLPEVPVAPVVWTSDATPERLGILLSEHGEALAWLSAEGGVFDLLAGRYSGGALNLDLLLKGWSGDPERVDRVGRAAIYLREPRLTLGLATQPDVVSGLAAQPAFRGRGLLGRFLYMLPPDTVGTRECVTTPIPADVLAAYALGLRAMLDWRRPGAEGDALRTVTLSPAAHREWHDFAVTIERELVPDGPLGSLRDWGSKLPGSAARVATVLHAIQHAHGEPWRHPIDVRTMDAALRIAARLREHAIAAYELLGADAEASAAERAWRWIAARRAPLLTVRDLLNGCRWLGRAAAAEMAAEQLAERGYLRIIRAEPRGPGRPPSPVLEVRPNIVRGWAE